MQLHTVVRIRAQNPVFWGTWGHTSPHAPEAVHTSENKTAQLLKWIRKDRQLTTDAAEIQRFCIVVGMCLRDLELIQGPDGSSNGVPEFLYRSCLEPDTRAHILQACAAAFSAPRGPDVGGFGKGKGKGKGRASAATTGLAVVSTGAPAEETEEATAPRRSKRNIARRS